MSTKYYPSSKEFLQDEKGVWEHLDKWAHVYEPNPFYIADFLKEVDKMTHTERVELIKAKGLLNL